MIRVKQEGRPHRTFYVKDPYKISLYKMLSKQQTVGCKTIVEEVKS